MGLCRTSYTYVIRFINKSVVVETPHEVSFVLVNFSHFFATRRALTVFAKLCLGTGHAVICLDGTAVICLIKFINKSPISTPESSHFTSILSTWYGYSS